jgi:sec-independent protein translocase protein TatA
MPFLGHLPELIVVMLLALLIFGPKRLPEMGKAIGDTVKSFQHSMREAVQAHDEAEAAPRALPPPASE